MKLIFCKLYNSMFWWITVWTAMKTIANLPVLSKCTLTLIFYIVSNKIQRKWFYLFVCIFITQKV